MNIFPKLKKGLIKLTSPYRNKKLNNRDFTIISNNCWAGDVYRYYNLPYNTPTVGLYLFGGDYIKFIYNLRYYLSKELDFISCAESKYKDILIQRHQENVIIGRIEDIEIIFLHYKTIEEAATKWKRRAERVNFDNIIIKFSNQNFCTSDDMKKFDELPIEKKLFFDNHENNMKCSVYIRGYENEDWLKDDIGTYRKYMNITDFINSPQSTYNIDLVQNTKCEFEKI